MISVSAKKARFSLVVLAATASLLMFFFLVHLMRSTSATDSPHQPASTSAAASPVVEHLTLDGYTTGVRDLLRDANNLLLAESSNPNVHDMFFWGLTFKQVVAIVDSHSPFVELRDFDRLTGPDFPIYLWKDNNLVSVNRGDLMSRSDLSILLVNSRRNTDLMGFDPFTVKHGEYNKTFTITCNSALMKFSGDVVIDAATDPNKSVLSVLSAKGPVSGSAGLITGGSYHVQGPMYIDCFRYPDGASLGLLATLNDVAIPKAAEICWSPAGRWIICYSYAYRDIWIVKRPLI